MAAENRGQGLGQCLPCLQLVLAHGKGLGAKIGDAKKLEGSLVSMATSTKTDKQNPILQQFISIFRGSGSKASIDRLRMRPPWPGPQQGPHGPRVQGRPVPRFGPDGQELHDLEPPGRIHSPGLVADESMWAIGWGMYLQTLSSLPQPLVPQCRANSSSLAFGTSGPSRNQGQWIECLVIS